MSATRLLACSCLLYTARPFCFAFPAEASSRSADYQQARRIRIESGPEAAAHIYKKLLDQYPDDLTTATHLAADLAALQRLEANGLLDIGPDKLATLREFFQSSGYDTDSIAQHIQAQPSTEYPVAPIYFTPAAAGTVTNYPIDIATCSALDVLISLFLVGLAIEYEVIGRVFSKTVLDTLMNTLLYRCTNNQVIALVPVTPVRLGPTNLWIVTDWHPRVLSSTTVGEHDAVMYIGPDSLALVQHWILDSHRPTASTIVDLCTGSGVQALALCAVHTQATALCVDINPRALQFTALNAALNGMTYRITCLQGNLLEGLGRRWDTSDSNNFESLESLVKRIYPVVDLITANPPFVPVPPALVKGRHGRFSDGGPNGESVLMAVVKLAGQCLAAEGFLAVVSEFFFTSNSELVDRIRQAHGHAVQGLLLTNEAPIDPLTYAERRADTLEEYEMWRDHLQVSKIVACSPGLLYLQQSQGSIDHRIVPKSKEGSIWTPANRLAIDFTREACRNYFFNSNNR